MTKQPIAFLSYVRADDEHEGGRLSQFRELLSREVRMQTGEEFPIFQDRNDIKWGQNWKQRLDNSLDAVTFLIPVITPGFFRSKPCRDELARFLAREKSLGRSDLVLPVYYINCPTLNDEVKRAGDDLAQTIYEHQYADWRELRFEPFTAPEMRRQIAKLATQIGEAIARFAPPTPTIGTSSDAGAPPRAAAAQAQDVSAGQTAPFGRPVAEKTEPPILVVDALHRGDFTTIADAIREARFGHRILVKPGLYTEALIIDKPLELLGDGSPGEVVVQAKDAHVILFRTTMGRIVNLSLRQLGGDYYAVDITQGRLVLENCDIISQGNSCVAIHNGAPIRSCGAIASTTAKRAECPSTKQASARSRTTTSSAMLVGASQSASRATRRSARTASTTANLPECSSTKRARHDRGQRHLRQRSRRRRDQGAWQPDCPREPD
jgi:F-box protein 11